MNGRMVGTGLVMVMMVMVMVMTTTMTDGAEETCSHPFPEDTEFVDLGVFDSSLSSRINNDIQQRRGKSNVFNRAIKKFLDGKELWRVDYAELLLSGSRLEVVQNPTLSKIFKELYQRKYPDIRAGYGMATQELILFDEGDAVVASIPFPDDISYEHFVTAMDLLGFDRYDD